MGGENTTQPGAEEGAVLVEGATYEQAVEAGLKTLNLRRAHVSIEVVGEPGRNSNKYVLRMTPVEAPPEAGGSPQPFNVQASQDGYEAYLSYYPQAQKDPIGREAVLAALKEGGVVFGVDPARLEELLGKIAQRSGFKRALIARGERAEEGKDAVLESLIDTEVSEAGAPRTEDDASRVDYRERRRTKQVNVGDRLAVKRPAVAGADGKKVSGEIVGVTRGKDIKLSVGPGVESVEVEGGVVEFRAKIEGTPLVQQEKIDVTTTTVIEGDVNYSSGNIHAKGSVVIMGNVSPGFEVHAPGDVTVELVVDAAKIVAGGDVLLKSGIKGADKGVIIADGSVSATYIERSTIEARGDIFVENILLDSNVLCGGKVKALGGKGQIIGGHIRAARGVEARRIGSDYASKTIIETGRDFLAEREFAEAESRYEKLSSELKKIESMVPAPVLAAGDLSRVAASKRDAFQRILEAWKRLKGEVEEIEPAIRRLQAQRMESLRSHIMAKEVLFPKVTLIIGTAKHMTNKEMHGVRAYEDRVKKEVHFSYR